MIESACVYINNDLACVCFMASPNCSDHSGLCCCQPIALVVVVAAAAATTTAATTIFSYAVIILP